MKAYSLCSADGVNKSKPYLRLPCHPFRAYHSSMRRIVAILPAVGALLFGAASAGADYDDGVVALERGDYVPAYQEFRLHAEQGDAKAQFNLGVMYDNGWGIPENDVEAVKWFRKAAEQGNISAQSNLGIMHVLGIGVSKDYVKAHMWFSLAKSEGHEGAAKSLDLVEKQMGTEQISEA